jgi:hypothetical protein
MRTTSAARAVRKPALVIAVIAAIVGAIACSDAAPTSPITQVAAPNTASASGYALASGKADTTKKK